MRNQYEINQKSKQTQIKIYGSYEAYKAEMRRRAQKGGSVGGGGFSDPKIAKRAAKKRWENEKNKPQEENQSQNEG